MTAYRDPRLQVMKTKENRQNSIVQITVDEGKLGLQSTKLCLHTLDVNVLTMFTWSCRPYLRRRAQQPNSTRDVMHPTPQVVQLMLC